MTFTFENGTELKKITTETADVWMDEEGILRVTIFAGADVKVQHVEELLRIYKQLGCGTKKVLQLMDGSGGFSMSFAAQSFVVKNISPLLIASALITKSQMVQIAVNIFMKIFTPSVPFRVFESEEKALQWLRTFTEDPVQ